MGLGEELGGLSWSALLLLNSAGRPAHAFLCLADSFDLVLLSSFTPHRRRDQLSAPQSLPGVSDFQAWKGMTLPVPWPLERDPASCDGWYVCA